MVTNGIKRLDAVRNALRQLTRALGALPLLFVCISTMLITTADLFSSGRWSILPTLTSTVSTDTYALYIILKLSLLLLSTIGASVALDRLVHYDILESKVSQLTRSYEAISNNIENHVRPLKDRAEWYRSFLEAIAGAPYGATVYVTAYEKLKMPFECGEESFESTVMELYNERIINGDITVEQIIHVATVNDLDAAWRRVNYFSNRPNFTLSIVVGISPDPMIEMATIEPFTTLIGTSTQASNPYAISCGHEIKSAPILAEFRQQMQLWSSVLGVPLKTRDGVNEEVYKKIRSTLPEIHALDVPHDLASTALSLLADEKAYDSVLRLLPSRANNNVNQTESVSGLVSNRMDAVLQSAVLEIEELARGVISFSGDGWPSLGKIISEACSTVFAIAPVNSLSFWQTPTGRGLQRQMGEAVVRGVEVVRAFLIRSNEELDYFQDVIDECQRLGIKVLSVVDAGDLNISNRDFLIVDDCIVFEDGVGATPGGSKMIVNPSMIGEYLRVWQIVLQFGIPIGN